MVWGVHGHVVVMVVVLSNHCYLNIMQVASYLASDRRMPRVEVRTEPTRDYWYVEDSPAPVPLKGEL